MQRAHASNTITKMNGSNRNGLDSRLRFSLSVTDVRRSDRAYWVGRFPSLRVIPYRDRNHVRVAQARSQTANLPRFLSTGAAFIPRLDRLCNRRGNGRENWVMDRRENLRRKISRQPGSEDAFFVSRIDFRYTDDIRVSSNAFCCASRRSRVIRFSRIIIRTRSLLSWDVQISERGEKKSGGKKREREKWDYPPGDKLDEVHLKEIAERYDVETNARR